MKEEIDTKKKMSGDWEALKNLSNWPSGYRLKFYKHNGELPHKTH